MPYSILQVIALSACVGCLYWVFVHLYVVLVSCLHAGIAFVGRFYHLHGQTSLRRSHLKRLRLHPAVLGALASLCGQRVGRFARLLPGLASLDSFDWNNITSTRKLFHTKKKAPRRPAQSPLISKLLRLVKDDDVFEYHFVRRLEFRHASLLLRSCFRW